MFEVRDLLTFWMFFFLHLFIFVRNSIGMSFSSFNIFHSIHRHDEYVRLPAAVAAVVRAGDGDDDSTGIYIIPHYFFCVFAHTCAANKMCHVFTDQRNKWGKKNGNEMKCIACVSIVTRSYASKIYLHRREEKEEEQWDGSVGPEREPHTQSAGSHNSLYAVLFHFTLRTCLSRDPLRTSTFYYCATSIL